MSPNLKAFLRVIREGESSQTDDAYRMIVGGGRFIDFKDHPRRLVDLPKLGVKSTAAGAYQFLSRTWDECVTSLRLPDFSPASQDAAAVFLITRRGALADVEAGRLEVALRKCAREWASLPGSPYGQPTITLKRAVETFLRWGGTLAPTQGAQAPTAPKEQPMAPFLKVALPALIELVPKLGKIFGSGSEVAERNIRAAETVAAIAKDVTDTVNEQAAIEKLTKDPELRATFEQEVTARWGELTEYGGGVQAAGQRNLVAPGASRNPALWVTAAILPLVYMTVWKVLDGEFAPEVKSMVVAAVVLGALGAVTAFWLGSSYGSQKKDERIQNGN